MPHHTKDLSRLMPVLRHATTHLGVEQTATGKALGFTNARMMALAAVIAAEPCSMSDLAAHLALPSPLATRVASGEGSARRAARSDIEQGSAAITAASAIMR